MLVPSAPLSDIDNDLILHDAHNKIAAGHLYLRQPHTVQIIQLVECSPPPRRIGSAIDSGSASSASSCDYSDEYSESELSEDAMEEDDEEEEVCSSYCSSDVSPEELETPLSFDEPRGDGADTYSVRMKRILAWRENFDAQIGASLSDSTFSLSLKRKCDSEDHDDTMAHSSKRSRSQASSLGALSCPACDATFFTPQSLRQHGRDAQANNEACCVAVEYAFE